MRTRKSATTKFGTEMPASEPTRMIWSVKRLARSAESTPNGTPMSTISSKCDYRELHRRRQPRGDHGSTGDLSE